jgi:hypothetical protein
MDGGNDRDGSAVKLLSVRRLKRFLWDRLQERRQAAFIASKGPLHLA